MKTDEVTSSQRSTIDAVKYRIFRDATSTETNREQAEQENERLRAAIQKICDKYDDWRFTPNQFVTPDLLDAISDAGDAIGHHWVDSEEELVAARSNQTTPEPKPQRYYILDSRSVVGNSALFWRVGGKGYTTEFHEAGLFELGYSSRETDIEIPEDVAKACQVTHVRLDTLRVEMQKRGIPWQNFTAAQRGTP